MEVVRKKFASQHQVNVDTLASAADHEDDGQNGKSLEEESGASDDSADDCCWNNQQMHQGRHLQNDVLVGKHVYSSNLSLYTQVANFAEGDAGMARELRGGLESMLTKFIEQKKSRRREEIRILQSMNLPVFHMWTRLVGTKV